MANGFRRQLIRQRRGFGGQRLQEKIKGICRLKAPPFRMATNDARIKTCCKLAGFGVFHQAFRKIGSPQIPSPTYFRVWKRSLIADRGIGHDETAFSNLRRFGWRQRTPEPKSTAYSQASGFFIRQSGKGRDSARYRVRHIFGFGRCHRLLTVVSIVLLPIDYFGESPLSALLRLPHR